MPVKIELEGLFWRDRVSVIIQLLFFLRLFFWRLLSLEQGLVEYTAWIDSEAEAYFIKIWDLFKVARIKTFVCDQAISYAFGNGFNDGLLLAIFRVVYGYHIFDSSWRLVYKIFGVHGKVVVVNGRNLVFSISINCQVGRVLKPCLFKVREESFLPVSVEHPRTKDERFQIWVRLSSRNAEGFQCLNISVARVGFSFFVI